LEALSELSLEDLLRIKLTTSTKSKPMSLRDSPNVMTLITREEILRSGARELADVLRLVPGITLNGDLYSSVFAGFRGIWGSEGKILLLLDGHEMFDLLYYGVELGNRIPIDQVERIEIIRGPGSVVHGGSAELAVINIITRSAKDLEGGQVTAIYGQMFDGAIHQGQSLADSFSRRTISAAFGRTFGDARELSLKAGMYIGQGNRSDQPYVDIDGATYNMAGNARTDPMLFHLSADYRGLKLSYLFEYYRTTMKDGYGAALSDTLPVNYLSSSLHVSYEWRLAQGLKLVPRLSLLNQKPWQTDNSTAQSPAYRDFRWAPETQRVLGGLTVVWDPVPTLNLLLGNDYNLDTAAYERAPNDPNATTWEAMHARHRNAAVYGQALLDTPLANLSAGARYEWREHVGSAFVPRAGATKTFGPFHFKLLASRAFRAPAIGNLMQTPDVKPEMTTVFEIELGYRLHPAVFAVVNAFDITIDHPFVYFFDSATSLDGYRNYDRMGTRGGEFELRFAAERHHANLSYSYYTAAGKGQIDTLAVPGHRSVLLGFAPHKIALQAGTGITKRLDVSVSALLFAGQRLGYYAYDASGTPVARDYGAELQLSAFLSYRDLFLPGSSVGVGVSNLANAKTVLIQAYDNGHPPLPGPSREVFLRIGYDFRRQ
jgi:outer membrane receptor protein involved in Fe transport